MTRLGVCSRTFAVYVIFISSVLSTSFAQWVSTNFNGCVANPDTASFYTNGSAPDPNLCRPGSAFVTATCWTDRPPRGSFCIYTEVPWQNCTGGVVGSLFGCSSYDTLIIQDTGPISLSLPRSYPPPGDFLQKVVAAGNETVYELFTSGRLYDLAYDRVFETTWGLVKDVAIGGGGHTLVLTADGNVWSWGNNLYGQIGFSDTIHNYSFQAPYMAWSAFNIGGRAVAVAAGQDHSVLLTSTDLLLSWGNNQFGQFGIGTSGYYSHYPNMVNFTASGIPRVCDVQAGNGYTFVRSCSGRLYSWGRNDYGQLGHGDLTDRLTPSLVTFRSSFWSQVSVSNGLVLAISDTGLVFWWGYPGASGYVNTPSPGSPIVSVVATLANAAYAKTLDGSLYAWSPPSCNFRGCLGNTNITQSYELLKIDLPSRVPNQKVKQITGSYLYTLVLVAEGQYFFEPTPQYAFPPVAAPQSGSQISAPVALSSPRASPESRYYVPADFSYLSESGLSLTTIIGITVAVGFVVIAAVLIVVMVVRRRRKSNRPAPVVTTTSAPHPSFETIAPQQFVNGRSGVTAPQPVFETAAPQQFVNGGNGDDSSSSSSSRYESSEQTLRDKVDEDRQASSSPSSSAHPGGRRKGSSQPHQVELLELPTNLPEEDTSNQIQLSKEDKPKKKKFDASTPRTRKIDAVPQSSSTPPAAAAENQNKPRTKKVKRMETIARTKSSSKLNDRGSTKAINPALLAAAEESITRGSIWKSEFMSAYSTEFSGSRISVRVFNNKRGAFAEDENLGGALLRRLQVASALSHPNVEKIQGCFTLSDLSVCYITNALPQESLLDILQQQAPLELPVALKILRQISGALNFLHNGRKIVHGELTPEKIQTSSSGKVLLTEVGLRTTELFDRSRWISDSHVAPEVRKDPSNVSLAADVWSFGMICIDMFSPPRETPRSSVDDSEPSDLVQRIPDPDLRQTALSCLSFEPNARPSMANINLE